MPELLVSACLAGRPCRYDGAPMPDDEIVALVREGRALPVCAEELAGLPTPRDPAEIVGGDGEDVLAGRARVVTSQGEDVTREFIDGAQRAASHAEAAGITGAILQARSPSCGCRAVYDGTHRGVLRDGPGVFAAELLRRGMSTQERRGRRVAERDTAPASAAGRSTGSPAR